MLGMTVVRVSIAFKCPRELVYYLKGKKVDFYVRKLSELYMVRTHVGRRWGSMETSRQARVDASPAVYPSHKVY